MSRTVWLLVDDLGVPQGFKWASVKTPSEEPDADLKSWSAALSDAEVTAGWDAHETSWYKVPPLARPGVLTDVGSGASYAAGVLTTGGVDYTLADTPRLDAIGCKLCPDGTVSTLADTVALAESLGMDIDFVEKTTLKKVRIWSTQDPADAHPGTIDSGIYRQSSDSQVVRADA
jgi:hypothetical protein